MTSDTLRTDCVYCGAFTAKRFGALASLIAQNTALVLIPTRYGFETRSWRVFRFPSR